MGGREADGLDVVAEADGVTELKHRDVVFKRFSLEFRMNSDASDSSLYRVFAVSPKVVHAQNSSPVIRVPRKEFMYFFYNDVQVNPFLDGIALTDRFTLGFCTFRNIH